MHVPNATLYTSGLDWWMYEDQFLPVMLTYRNTRPWAEGSIVACQVRHEWWGDIERLQGTLSLRFRDIRDKEHFIDTFNYADCAGRIVFCEDARRELDIPPRHKWKGLDIGFPRYLEDVYNIPQEEMRKAADARRKAARRANMDPRNQGP